MLQKSAKKPRDEPTDRAKDTNDDNRQYSSMGSPEAPGSEASGLIAGAGQASLSMGPLAIHHLQAIIKLESDLEQLNETVDLAVNSNPKAKMIAQDDKAHLKSASMIQFPKIFPENFQLHDFMQKINYIDRLINRYNSDYLRWYQLCQLNHEQLGK